MKIFVIHARRTGYGVIRALRSFTKNIYIADTFQTPVFHSRYVKQSFLIKDITKVDKLTFIEDLIHLAKQMDYKAEKPVVFTGKDDYLLFFSQNSEELSPYFDFSFESDIKILESVLNKKKLALHALRANVPIPKTYTDEDDLDDILMETEPPLIIKPAIKNRPEIDVVSTAFRIRTCNSKRELEESISLLNRSGQSYVIQEYIPGNDSELYSLGAYSYRGKLKAWSITKKIRQFPPHTGECSYGESIYSTDLVDYAINLLRVSGFTGISQMEFKKYKDIYYLLEINPRVWSWHQINTMLGVNFCKIAFDNVNGQLSDEIVSPSPESKYWMFLTMDVLHNYLLNKNESIFKIVRDFLSCDIEAFLSFQDPAPFFYHLKRTIPYMYQEVKRAREIQR